MDIIKVIDDFLLQENERKFKKITSHWPSNASCLIDGKLAGKCLRAQWYGWKGYKQSNPFTIDSLWTMFMGKCIHLGIQKIFEKLDITAKAESRVEYTTSRLKPKVIRGKIDILFSEMGEEGIWSGLEIKSTYGRSIIDPINGVRYAGPKQDHMCQILPYMFDVSGIIFPYHILYLARDSGWRENFNLIYEKDVDRLFCEGKDTGVTWSGIITRWETLEKYLKSGDLPPRDYDLQYPEGKLKIMWDEYMKNTKAKKPMTLKAYSKDRGDWQCKWCLYKDLCHEKDELKPNNIGETEKWQQRQGISNA